MQPTDRLKEQQHESVADRLGGDRLGELAERLGFTAEDGADLQRIAPVVLADESAVSRIVDRVGALEKSVGNFTEQQVFATEPGGGAAGVEAMLALLAATDSVRALHRSRGITEEDSWRALSDLGQQVAVHRLVFGEFGLHTQNWLVTAWSGALYWLGRLQFNLVRPPSLGRWVLSTHIPRSGSLAPELVDASFVRAKDFFAAHFPDHPVAQFHCRSWLLDPGLSALGDSNVARFAARWTLIGEPEDGDADVEFFVFRTRARPPHHELVPHSSLERVITERWADGGHWGLCEGVIDIDEAVPARNGA